MKCIFLDSDVILDFLRESSPQSDFTTTILTLAEQKQIKVFVSPLLYGDLYNLFVQKEGHKKMIEKLRNLNSLARSLRINNKIIKQALNSDLNHFGVSLQYFTARGYKKIEAIVTNRTEAYGHTKIAVFTPETYLVTIWNSAT